MTFAKMRRTMAKRNKKGGYDSGEWMSVDNTLCFEMWMTLDQISLESDVKPGIAKMILDQMVKNNEAIRRGKKYKRI